MVLHFGDCIQVDDVYGLVMVQKGHFKTIMVFEKHGNQLIATPTTYISKTKITKFMLTSEPSDTDLWCNSALINGKEETIEWIHPADIADTMFPVGSQIPEPKPLKPKQDPVTPKRQKTSSVETPSRGRKFKVTPKKLFNADPDNSSSNEFSEDDEEEELGSEEEGDRPADAIRSTPRKRSLVTPSSRQKRARASKESATSSAPNLTPVTPKKRKRGAAPADSGPLKSLPISPHKAIPETPRSRARNLLHVAFVPESLPCRTKQFSRLFFKLQEAINNKTGTCIYVSGTPGTGKSSTIREVIEQLMIRKEDGELGNFDVLEINGMRLPHATLAYDALYEHLHSDEPVGTKLAMAALECQFNDKKNNMKPLVVIMEELDQLLTKDQSVIYNFFNWPTLPSSRLIVIAVSNTLDMPERLLQNKIKSRLGLENIKFPGYNQLELREILNARLEDSELVLEDAIEYVARKVGNVSGDARRALDICRRAVELTPNGEPVTLDNVLLAIKESQKSASVPILASLSLCSKIFLLALFQFSKTTDENVYPATGVLHHCREFIKITPQLSRFDKLLFGNGQVRMRGYQHAITELLEGGLIVQESTKGDATGSIRLNVDLATVESSLINDEIIPFKN